MTGFAFELRQFSVPPDTSCIYSMHQVINQKSVGLNTHKPANLLPTGELTATNLPNNRLAPMAHIAPLYGVTLHAIGQQSHQFDRPDLIPCL